MQNLPSLRCLIEEHNKIKERGGREVFVKWLGVYQQEAHDKETWPIGLSGALPPTFSCKDRKENATTFLARYPSLEKVLDWYIDMPEVSTYIGGSFQNVLNSWPHRYFVFQRTKLIWRAEYRWSKEGKVIEFSDLRSFLSEKLQQL